MPIPTARVQGSDNDDRVVGRLMARLIEDEADLGYRGEDIKINTPNEYGKEEVEAMKARVRARHETVNRRIRHFLEARYRHRICDHSRYF